MATSQITAIYAAIESVNVTFNLRGQSRTPTVKGLTELPNRVESADLPLRLLLNVQNNAEGVSFQAGTLGSGLGGGAKPTIIWRITDLMLALPQNQGTGVKDVAYDLMAYCSAYLAAVRNNIKITSGALVEDVSVEPGVYLYPASETGVAYYGVQCVWSIKELVD